MPVQELFQLIFNIIRPHVVNLFDPCQTVQWHFATKQGEQKTMIVIITVILCVIVIGVVIHREEQGQ